ncbi:winged helix-turn-helix domain-containing protein [Methylotetracoccus oryzae]|uniref:winged helix-turn-helix domain-containing protein n=1 Tax=Methylotetracoccus oryzae TaxID=1919059 RepID=UPI00111B1763
MTVPTYDKFIEPILRYLAGHPNGALARDAHEAAAQTLGLSDADRQELLPSGTQPVYKNRAGWAHDRLKRAGLSSSPRRGYWQLTPRGVEFGASHAPPLSAADVEQLAVGFMDVRLRERGDQPIAPPPLPNSSSARVTASPDDRLGEAIVELRSSVAAELLDALKTASPSFFETIVLDLLHKMGYGASRADLQRVGGSGDGGIDGGESWGQRGIMGSVLDFVGMHGSKD